MTVSYLIDYNPSYLRYRQSRKKGLMSLKDCKNRLYWARKIRRLNLGGAFWENGVSLYLDASGFVHKNNPYDQAMTPGSRIWRRRCEGIDRGCTTKGAKEGVTQARFIVGISYSRGVVLCEVIPVTLNTPVREEEGSKLFLLKNLTICIILPI